MTELPSIYDMKFTSLKDIMIPGHVFIDMVKYIEKAPFYQFKYSASDYDGSLGEKFLQTHYMMPYPYILDTIQDRKSKNQEEIFMDINDRISSFIKFSLHCDVIDEIDNDPYTGVIVEITNGYIIKFSYNTLKNLLTSAIPESLINIFNSVNVAKHLSSTQGSDDYSYFLNGKAIISSIYDDDKYRTIYNMLYDNPKYNCYRIGTSTDIADLNFQQYLVQADYVMRRIKERQKIIITI